MSPLDQAFEEALQFSPEIKTDVREAMKRGLISSVADMAFQLLYVVADCKSPIEQLFAAAIWGRRGFNTVFHLSGDRHIRVPGWNDELSGYGVLEVTPQAKVGRFSADFLLERTGGARPSRIAVECDGHDFHEKTKGQAAHDKKRDRFFAAQRLTVLRFTGSEIARDATSCVFEALEQLRREGQ